MIDKDRVFDFFLAPCFVKRREISSSVERLLRPLPPGSTFKIGDLPLCQEQSDPFEAEKEKGCH